MLVVVSVPPERIGRDSSKARTRLRGPEGEPFIGTAVANVSFKSLPPADSTSFLRPTNSPRGLWRRPETATTVQIWTFHFLVLIFFNRGRAGVKPFCSELAPGWGRPLCLRGALCDKSLAEASLARRSAVRFAAATMDAFLARSDRSSAVIVSRLRLPPILPPFLPNSVMT